MSKTWLLIDDERNLNCDVICRTGELGVEYLRAFHKDVECLVLDHDLGSGIDGYQVITIAIEENVVPDEVQIVSSNPVGVKRIGDALISAGYSASPDRRFFRKNR